MRRLTLILLLVALPLQSAWAAFSVHCKHEQDPAHWHVGHHMHEHSQDTKAGGSSGSHQDAHHSVPVVLEEGEATRPLRQATALVAFEPPLALAEIASEPERPKWSVAG